MMSRARFSLYARYGLKTGIACVLAYAASIAIGSSYAVWAVVSAVIATQINVADSIQAGLLRSAGTVLGALTGILLLCIVPATHFSAGVTVFFLCTGFGFLTVVNAKVSSNACIAASIVLLMGLAVGKTAPVGAAVFGLMRMAEIILGVGCAFVVSFWVWPNRLMDTLRTDLSLQFEECARILGALMEAILDQQRHFPEKPLEDLEKRVRENHERLTRAKKHESILYRFEHAIMNTQVAAVDRTLESLRTIKDALNDYEESGSDLLVGAELRSLAEALASVLRHLGGQAPADPAPELIRAVTGAAGAIESRLAELREQHLTATLPLHRVLQLYTFYQSMRQLAESLLLFMDSMQNKAGVFNGGQR